MSSGWYDCTEPCLSTLLQGKQGVQGAYATSSNLLTTHQLYWCVEFYHITEPLYLKQSRKFSVCRVVVHLFGVVQAHQTSSKTYTNHIITEIARCVEVYHMSSGWFDRTEPSLCTSLQGKQGVQGAYALVRGGSSTSNLIEPTQTTTSQR